MNTRFSRAGFTLIELLVVISLIALTASLVFASLKTARDRATASGITSQIRQYIIALELYRDDHGQYPDIVNPGGSGSCLGTGYPGGKCGWLTTTSAALEDPILNNLIAPYISSNHSFNFGTVSWDSEYGYWDWRGAYYFCSQIAGVLCASIVIIWRVPSAAGSCRIPGAHQSEGGGSFGCQIVLQGNPVPDIVQPPSVP